MVPGAAWVSRTRSRLSRLKKLSGKFLSAIGPRTMDARIVMVIPAPAHRVFDIVARRNAAQSLLVYCDP